MSTQSLARCPNTARCPPPMTDHDAEMDALVQQLVTAGLLETFTADDGDEACA
jgi:hypothetical protein